MLPPSLQADGGGAHLLLRQAEGLQPPSGGDRDGPDDRGRGAAPQTQRTRQKPVRCVHVFRNNPQGSMRPLLVCAHSFLTGELIRLPAL